jgi:ABC-2 type transport system ATP-binding protein
MNNDVAIKAEGISKYFKPTAGQGSIKQLFTGNSKKHAKKDPGYWALKDINFEVKKGEFFGIVGRNGSGKSTLLKMIAGVYTPTSGAINVNGKLVPFIELGVGFNPELSGRDNVFLNGALLGFSHKEMEKMYDDIVEFAELKDHMDVRLKNFSSGMQVRLAFSIAIRAKSDILLIDEVLAVGDAAFQRKCFDYFRLLKNLKKTVVFVTHDMNTVKEYCDSAMLIEKSKVLRIGSPDEIARDYQNLTKPPQTKQKASSTAKTISSQMKITKSDVIVNDKNVEVSFAIKFLRETVDPVFGYVIHSPIGQKLVEANSLWNKLETNTFYKNSTANITWTVANIFTNGTHKVTLAVCDKSTQDYYIWDDNAADFYIDKDEITTAATLPLQIITIER